MRPVVARRGPAVAGTALAGAALAVAVLTGCAPSVGSVDDETLFEQMRTVPGVETVDVRFERDPTYGPHYEGEIVLEPGLSEDAVACVVVQVRENLWQGRETQTNGVALVHDDRRELLTVDDVLEERYGPRPSQPRESATLTPCDPTTGP
ncbi:hypothetical protein ACFUMH_18890 [Cellulomonas sp. NPDC057328]|uniref:hypothetical protein n=1 Tax=Cellulomonas sp. NPDC057328 TaxID=3346101 RepID=UPI00363C6415